MQSTNPFSQGGNLELAMLDQVVSGRVLVRRAMYCVGDTRSCVGDALRGRTAHTCHGPIDKSVLIHRAVALVRRINHDVIVYICGCYDNVSVCSRETTACVAIRVIDVGGAVQSKGPSNYIASGFGAE